MTGRGDVDDAGAPDRAGQRNTRAAELLRGTGEAAARAVRRAPLTVVWTALALAAGLVTGSITAGPSLTLLDAVGTGAGPLGDGRWWTPVTAMAFWGTWPGYLATAVVVLVAGLVAERRLGSLRTAGLLVGTQVAGTLLVVGAVAAASALGSSWGAELAGQVVVGGAPGGLGLALAASHHLSALWRRRIRLVVLVGVVMLVLYSGELTDGLLLGCALVGLAAGPFVHRPAVPDSPIGSSGSSAGLLPADDPGTAGAVRAPSRLETRVLVALVVAASAVGPVVAAIAQAPIGPLSVLQFVVLSPPPDAATVQEICRTADATTCASLQAQLRLYGVGPALASVVPVLLLLVTAEGLRRGRRVAWVVGLVLNLGLAVLGTLLAVEVAGTPSEQLVVYGGAPGARQVLGLVLPPLLPLAVAVLLLVTRARFRVPVPPGSLRRLLAVTAATFAAVSVLYVVGGSLLAAGFDRPPSAGQLLADLPLRFLPPGYLGEVEPPFLPQDWLPTVLFEWTGVVFWLVVAAGLLRVSVAGGSGAGAGTGDAARARELLVRHGGGDLGWLTTWPGQEYWFAADGESCVAHRVLGSVAVTTADPVGPPRQRAAAVRGFAEHCRDRGLTPAFYSVTDDTRDACTALGWSSVQVAEETVIPLPGLAFTGKRWQDVRSALNRAGKDGVTAEWITFRHAPLAITDQIRAISEEWVVDKGLPEMGFTLGGVEELADDGVRCLVALDADRTVHGVTSWMPVHADGAVVGWTLDFMRRRGGTGEGGRQILRGVMEFLIASAAQDFRDEGARFASLSGAPLAKLDRGEAPTGLARLLEVTGHALEPVYGFRSLLAFKAKFQPTYAPLHLCYPDPVALPAIGVAIGRAYLPGLTARQTATLVTRLRDRDHHPSR